MGKGSIVHIEWKTFAMKLEDNKTLEVAELGINLVQQWYSLVKK